MRKALLFFVALFCLGMVGCVQQKGTVSSQKYQQPVLEKRVRTDSFSGEVTYQYDIRITGSSLALPPKFQPIVIEKKGKKTLMVFLTYIGSDWIFVDDVQIKIDNSPPVKVVAMTGAKNVGSGYSSAIVYEGMILRLTPQELKKIADAQTVVFRMSGKKGHHDITLTQLDQEGSLWILSILNGS